MYIYDGGERLGGVDGDGKRGLVTDPEFFEVLEVGDVFDLGDHVVAHI